MTIPQKKVTAEERAKVIQLQARRTGKYAPGKGFVRVYDCALDQIKQAETLAAQEAREEGKKEAHRTMLGLQTVLQRSTDLTDGFDDGWRLGAEAMRERAEAIALKRVTDRYSSDSAIEAQYIAAEICALPLTEAGK